MKMLVFVQKRGGLASVSEGYKPLLVRVGAELVSFTGREIISLPQMVSDRAENQSGQDYTLYETPHEGYKLHIREWHIKGSILRRPGESAAKIERTSTLYSEQEAKQNYPVLYKELVRRAQILKAGTP
jgi:hypothetical protein